MVKLCQIYIVDPSNDDRKGPKPGGGGFSLYAAIGMCHFGGRVLEIFALHKGLLLRFCLTKGSLFSLKIALQKGPFLLKIEVSPLKNACFTDFKGKNFRKSSESYIFRQFCPLFREFALQKGQFFGAHAPY